MFTPDPDLGFLPIPDPGVKRHWIPAPDPQHCSIVKVLVEAFNLLIEAVRVLVVSLTILTKDVIVLTKATRVLWLEQAPRVLVESTGGI